MRRIWNTLRSQRGLLPVVLAVLSTGLVTLATLALREQFDLAILVLAYMLPVGLSAFLWGFGPGLAAALASFFLLNYYFIPPYGSLLIHQPQHLLVLVSFLVLTISISRLVGRMRDGLETARRRENETKRMYELSTDLSGSLSEHSILNTLARHIYETFQADRVEILLETDDAHDWVSWPEEAGAAASPMLLTSLQGSQGLLGEIRLWREEASLNPAENRLLNLFASQGVLALERARLVLAATRAHILEESDQMKSALLSSVSHELRTPLATIKASVTSLRDDSFIWDAAARSDLLAVIEEETDLLNQLVGNLLSMSRIQAGALQLEREWNDLHEVIAPSLRRARAASPSHPFEIEIPNDLPLVNVDYTLMEQVFNNLFSNSIKYSPPGSTIRVRALQENGTLQIQVINQGPPVSEQNLERIFEKFHRVTAADKITGTGLGLSICKGIIEAHQGHIWAENLPDGFTILFTLPIRAEEAIAEQPGP
jgi:two-component system sensor histidine kinase KdpD